MHFHYLEIMYVTFFNPIIRIQWSIQHLPNAFISNEMICQQLSCLSLLLCDCVTEWVTDDLLKQIQGNDALAKKLENPGFAQALNEFQANPQAAMMKYGSNPEMQAFLMEFCRVLGGFTLFYVNTLTLELSKSPISHLPNDWCCL